MGVEDGDNCTGSMNMSLRAGDTALGWITGTAVNQDGKSASFNAPNELAQEKMLLAAQADAKRGQCVAEPELAVPVHTGYIETHGTGTKLGDPVEALG